MQLFALFVSLESVRLFRFLLTALFAVFAVLAGLLTAAAVAVGGILVYFVHRLVRSKRISRLPSPREGRTAPSSRGEIIEVSATEVSSDSSSR